MSIKTGSSNSKDEKQAVEEVLQQVSQADIKCVVFFVSSHYDQFRFSEAINHCKVTDIAYRDVEFVGCTSAGEFNEQGFMQESVAAMSFASPELKVGIGVGKQISENPIGAAKKAVEKACGQLEIALDDLDEAKYNGLVLIDGLQSVEEYVMLGVSKIARHMPVAGGSAGDDYDFKKTIIHARGKTYENAMVLIIFSAEVPVRIIQTSQYLPTTTKLKITKADLDSRTVYELDGRPATEVYAHALGVDEKVLTADFFIRHPLALAWEEEFYIRSILKILPEEKALVFFSHISEGMNVTVMQPGNILLETRDVIRRVQADMPDISGIVAFNCILRYREVAEQGFLDDLIRELSVAPLIGFNTYGEQYNGMHVNQTMTLIVFGRAEIAAAELGNNGCETNGG